MIVDLINEYRRKNGRENIFCWNPVENDNCMQHCLYMVRLDRFEHSPEYLRPGKAEAIASCSFIYDTVNTMGLLLAIIDGCQDHRNIVLNYNNLAYGFCVHNYMAYLVIRGW